MSRNDEYNSASLEAPLEKMAALEEELAREDAKRSEENKYAPKEGASLPPASASSPSPSMKEDEVAPTEEGKRTEEAIPSKKSSVVHSKKKEREIEKEEDDEDEIVEEIIEQEDEGRPRVSSLVWNVAIVVVIFLIGGMGYMYWQQMQTMPKTPLENAMEDYKVLKKKYTEHKMASFDVQKRQIANDIYLQKLEQIASLEETAELKKKKIDDIKREIMGVRGEIRAYYARYKENTRKKARDLHFDSIMTVKTGKTYLDAYVQRVVDDYVSIVHAGGAIRIAPDDLPEAIRTRLAYGDPLGIAVMDEELRQQQKDSERVRSSASSVAEKMDAGRGRVYNGAPVAAPVRSVRLAQPSPPASVSSSELEPPSGLPHVDTSHEESLSSPASSATPVPSDANWKPAPVPAPFLES